MAEKKKKPSIVDMIGAQVGDVSIAAMDAGAKAASDPDTKREQIVYLPRTSLVADENNFYSMEGIEELAANIETVGLLDPIRVRRIEGEDDLFRVVSGHRRRAALDKLALDGHDLGDVPCIVEKSDGVSPALAELRLIFANSDTRRMSSADISKQAERVEALLYQLKEEGFEFPGRMRDHVAEACKTSATKLANLKVIREKLIPEWRSHWEKGELNDACALKLAQAEATVQRAAKMVLKNKADWHEYMFESLIACDTKDAAEKNGCGEHCANVRGKMEQNGWQCRHVCCKECYNLRTCENSCVRAAEAKEASIKKAEAEKQASIDRNNALREQQNQEHEKRFKFNRALWERLGEAMKVKNVSAPEVVALFIDDDPADCDEAEVSGFEKAVAGKKRGTEDGCMFSFDDEPYDSGMEACFFVELADKLGVSLDYLLCRTDEPNGSTAAPVPDAAPTWRTGTPDKEGWYAVIDQMGDYETLYWRERDANWFSHESAVRPYLGEDETIEHWLPLPRRGNSE